jgi:divalent metal cation (Fe/Co/Zn/Cd) transporter
VHWSIASVAWTAVASTVAIVGGIAAHSLLLVVFGAVGVLDAAGSTVLAFHFRHALHHERISERRERQALVAIAAGMALIALATSVQSVHRLVSGSHDSEFSIVGTSVAAASIVALSVLATGKRRIARRVGSRALLADSHVSAMGAVLAVCTSVGTIATNALDWWWLDPVASLVVAFVALAVSVGHVREG